MNDLFLPFLLFLLFLIAKEDLFSLQISGRNVYILSGYTFAYFVFQKPTLLTILLFIILSYSYGKIFKKCFNLAQGDNIIIVSLLQILIFNYYALLTFTAMLIYSLVCFNILATMDKANTNNKNTRIPFTIIILYSMLVTIIYAKIY